jgi:hypothetical protein
MGFNVKIGAMHWPIFMVRPFKIVKIRGFIGTRPLGLMSNKWVNQ